LFKRRFDDSLAEFELALRLNPNFSLAQGYYGLALSYCGRWREGDLAVRRALRLSPRDPFSAIYCGIASYAQFVGRNYAEAIRLAREGIRQRGDFRPTDRRAPAFAPGLYDRQQILWPVKRRICFDASVIGAGAVAEQRVQRRLAAIPGG
jgi:tetratricopeptide (TPR) repeat protein